MVNNKHVISQNWLLHRCVNVDKTASIYHYDSFNYRFLCVFFSCYLSRKNFYTAKVLKIALARLWSVKFIKWGHFQGTDHFITVRGFSCNNNAQMRSLKIKRTDTTFTRENICVKMVLFVKTVSVCVCVDMHTCESRCACVHACVCAGTYVLCIYCNHYHMTPTLISSVLP